MGLLEALHADAPQGTAAAGEDHRCQGNKKNPNPNPNTVMVQTGQ